jgi:Domain of unknown function (DUF4129)
VTGASAALSAVLPRDLDPSTEQARQWLSDELARSEYQDTRSLFQRLMDWLADRLADLQSTQGTGGWSFPPIVITLVVVVVVAGILFLLTRIRVESKSVSERKTLLADSVLTADQLRREAERALAENRFRDAVLAWTRAIARDAESRTLLPDAPSMTAHEVGAALAVAFPAHRGETERTMDLFDAVAYGDLTATREDALLARSTDAALHAAKPVLPSRPGRGSRTDDGMPVITSPPNGSGDEDRDSGSVWMTGVRS